MLVRLARTALLSALLLCATPGFAARRVPPRQTSSSKQVGKSGSKTRARNAKRKPREPAQLIPTSARIREIQTALAAQGTYKGEPSGKWDDATEESMKQFQSAHGLTPSGKLDALSLQKLGLGSETAGRGAPLPVAQSSQNGDPVQQ